jgi:hypothetical protein
MPAPEISQDVVSGGLEDELDADCCYICLQSAGDELLRPCRCNAPIHSRCLARWQLQNAGKK